jgi:Asp-tRNA(Asn)/Glu-tRNA(Gln) amidotransferase A subunit family amidase
VIAEALEMAMSDELAYMSAAELALRIRGSSGGSAAAVADGMLPLAEGTDGGGSIRIPASWCGVYGYKHSFGRVPFIARPNAFAADALFLFEGPITRTVEDAALALTATIRAIPTALTRKWTSRPPRDARSGAGRSHTARTSTCSRWILG